MGFFLFDHFKVEPFDLNFQIFILGGFWPLNTNVRWKKIAFSIYSFFSYFSLTSIIAVQLLDLYLLRHDFEQFTKDLSTIAITFTIVGKGLLINNRAEEANALRRSFTRYKNSRTDPEERKIIEASDKQILTILRVFYSLTIPCIALWLASPRLEGERAIPFPYKLPIENWSETVYEAVYIYQSISCLGFVIIYLCIDCIFCAFILRIRAHFDIVIRRLKKLGKADNHKFVICGTAAEKETKLVLKMVKETVENHKKILKEIEMVQYIYEFPTLMHYVGVTTIIGTAVFDLVRMSDGFKISMLQKILYLVIGLWDTFLYCSFASMLQHKSIELSHATYEIKWYTLKPQLRKILQLLCLKSQKVPKIKVKNLFTLDLSFFLKMLKISYDLTALLYHTYKK